MVPTSRRFVRKQSKLWLFVIFMIMVLIMAVCSVKAVGYMSQEKELAVTESSLQDQLEVANQKSVELKEKEKYMQTKRYIEDEAKNKLGLVQPGEIVIKPDRRNQ